MKERIHLARSESNNIGLKTPADQGPQAGASAAEAPLSAESPETDAHLVRRCCDGEQAAFDPLVERYQDRICNLLYRMCGSEEQAKDLAQETFLQAFRALNTFRQGAAFYTWLYRIAVNKALSLRRQEGRRSKNGASVSLDAVRRDADGEEPSGLQSVISQKQELDPARHLEQQWVRERVREGLSEIEPDYRAILLLRDIEGLDYDRIAETLEISKAAVKSRLHRARMEMARLLRDVNA